jgi:hypothetical protein
MGMVMRETMKLVRIGMAVGLVSAFAATRVWRHQLFGLEPSAPITIGVAVAVMGRGHASRLYSSAPSRLCRSDGRPPT